MIKKFYIFKAKEQKTDKSPTHNIVYFEGEGDTKKTFYFGSCWAKKSKSGVGYLSCAMNNPYNDKKGYHISEDKTAETTADAPPQDDEFDIM